MQNREIIVPGTLMKHFKGMLYQIVSIAIHSETREEYVVYQALYGDFKTYIRPLDMFLSEVDHEKYPDVTQKFRFEVYMPEKTVEKSTSSVPVEESSELDAMLQEIHLQHSIKTKESESVDTHQVLLDFLDARSHQDKLEQLDLMKKHVDSHIVNSMAISMDIVLATDTVEEQLEEIRNCLLTHIRFEDRRLR
ncbi:Protein of unknown function [Anaerosporobacter mobilis DSM 15930]|jgi:hypothetical protein|uniref:DUF1653 domain-containing protein n=1 Tax=Anaerosporobacter mobilis DSM 15930 TaxID=1120996 RepID=A0A1M7MUB1_9FIRM|nr:DUF1653 domain-containing protein [Anaerosporobacter mobilis]SHM94608.1 Protein of unknown function [Anaerosporobacter mobilis DSM 15930]